ncbi:MAG: hypothetical protein VYD19_09325 [Myxococcota bacterium]|nr:hypothetical protein [Myxococcota bacterium]
MSSDARQSEEISQEPISFSGAPAFDGPISVDEKGVTLELSRLELPSLVEGTLDDLVLRPNKFFHPRKRPRFSPTQARIDYASHAEPVTRRVTEEELLKVLDGVISAQRTRLTKQPLTLYPGREAFALDSRDRLRVVLMNCWPREIEEMSELQLSTLAFLELIEYHCPSAAKRIRQSGESPMTLLHLRELLTRSQVGAILKRVTVLVLLLVALIVGLTLRGPAPIRDPLQALFTPHYKQAERWVKAQLESPQIRLQLSLSSESEQLSPRPEALLPLLDEIFGAGRYRIGAHPSEALRDGPMLAAQWNRLCRESDCPERGWIIEIPHAEADLSELMRRLSTLSEPPFKIEQSLLRGVSITSPPSPTPTQSAEGSPDPEPAQESGADLHRRESE